MLTTEPSVDEGRGVRGVDATRAVIVPVEPPRGAGAFVHAHEFEIEPRGGRGGVQRAEDGEGVESHGGGPRVAFAPRHLRAGFGFPVPERGGRADDDEAFAVFEVRGGAEHDGGEDVVAFGREDLVDADARGRDAVGQGVGEGGGEGDAARGEIVDAVGDFAIELGDLGPEGVVVESQRAGGGEGDGRDGVEDVAGGGVEDVAGGGVDGPALVGRDLAFVGHPLIDGVVAADHHLVLAGGPRGELAEAAPEIGVAGGVADAPAELEAELGVPVAHGVARAHDHRVAVAGPVGHAEGELRHAPTTGGLGAGLVEAGPVVLAVQRGGVVRRRGGRATHVRETAGGGAAPHDPRDGSRGRGAHTGGGAAREAHRGSGDARRGSRHVDGGLSRVRRA